MTLSPATFCDLTPPPSSSSTDATAPTEEASSTVSEEPTTTTAKAEPEEPTATETIEALPLPSACGNLTPRFANKVADGWEVTKIAGSLTRPRGMTVDTLGNLIIDESGKGISVHTFGADGCIASSKDLIDNPQLNHGVGLTPDGKTLYASSLTTMWRWDYDAETQTVSGVTVMVKGMNPGGHPSRALYIPPQAPNLVVMQVGSNENFDMECVDPATPRAVIRVFDMDTAPEGGWDYATEGWLLGYGLRNEIAMAFDGDGNVWGVENSGDEFQRYPENGGNGYDIHNENPAEELNFLGDPTKPNENWYGYPACFTVWDPSVITDTTFSTGSVFINAPNTSFTDQTCAERTIPPRLSIQSHSAPIDAHFDANFENLYITLHGSWNRDIATGYKVVEVPFQKSQGSAGPGLDWGYEPVAGSDSMEGYRAIFESENEGACNANTCMRPSGIVRDRAGTRLIVGSDNGSEGELFILFKV